jgi:hypothetical protein
MRYGTTIASIAVSGLTATAAPAAITPFFQGVNITATTDGVTPPPGIGGGYQTFDLMITLTPGDDFTSFRLLFDPIGPIFHHSLGQGGPNFGPPNSLLFPTFPVLEFDSYLRGPAGGVTVLGATDGTNDLPPPGIFDSDRLAVAAGDLESNTQGGTFHLIRLTFDASFGYPSASDGRLLGRFFSVQNDQGVMIAIIPEPGMMMACIALASLGLLRRPRACEMQIARSRKT